jgi:hypothetical protein
MHQVPGELLWVGHSGDLHDHKLLWDAGIEAIVDVALDEPFPDLPRDFIYCRFPLMDGGGNLPHLLQTAIMTTVHLLECKVPTLAVCSVGMSRSPAIASAALAVWKKEPLDDWLHKVSVVKSMDLSLDLWSDVAGAVRELQGK